MFKKVLLGILIFFLVIINVIAIYGLLDTFVFSKMEANAAREKEEAKLEEKKAKEEENNPNKEIQIGFSEEVLREREEAQKELEELQERTQEAMAISDDFGNKLQDLGNPLMEKEMADFSEYSVKDVVGRNVICIDPKSGLYGIVDVEKNPIISFKYQDISITSESFFIVKEGGKQGLLDSDGLQVISTDYDSLEELVRGYYLAKTKDVNGTTSKVFNRNGDEVFSVNKDVVSVLKENANYFMFQENGKYGIVDINGEVRLPANYDKLDLKDGKLYYKEGTGIGVVE